MSKLYSIKKVDSKMEFDALNCASKKLWNGDSLWAEMKFYNGTCFYHLGVKGEKMTKIAIKLVRQYVMSEECYILESQVTKGKKSKI